MTEIVNLTPHAIDVTYADIDGNLQRRTFPPSGQVCRVTTMIGDLPRIDGIPTWSVKYGSAELPPQKEGTYYLVSLPVGQQHGAERPDLIGPDTNRALRGLDGQIMSVPGFVRY